MSGAAEIAAAVAAASRVRPDGDGPYALPWYLAIGEPGAGRSTVLRSLALTWPLGEGPHRLGASQQMASWWVTGEAVICEPEAPLVGPQASREALRDFAAALRDARPREAVDGVLLFIATTDLVDADDRALEAYAHRLRGYLSAVALGARAEVPVYIVVSRYDTMWGFAEVFQWTPERQREEPWGFLLPGDTTARLAPTRLAEAIDGLGARLESFCFAKLSSEDLPEIRARAFQHVAEARRFIEKLKAVVHTLATETAFERAPWFRALALGSALPGAGDRPRAGVARFANMGLTPTQPPQGVRPGGLPLHGYLRDVVLPERELVPLRSRWRDHKTVVVPFVLGLVLWLAVLVTALVLALE